MNRIDSEDAPSEVVDLVRLQTFYEVARLGSVHRAAAALHRSQPALSHRLRTLQDELGVELFEKLGRNLRLTEAGRRLLHECGDLFALARSLKAALSQARGVAGRVVIGTLPTVTSHLIDGAIVRLLSEHAELQLSFTYGVVPDLLEALRAGGADLLILVGDVDAPDLQIEPLHSTQLVVVMAPALAPRGNPLTPQRLRQMRFLAWDGPPDPTFERVQRYVARHRLTSTTSPRIPNIETLRNLAAAGAGYAILPEYTVRRDVRARHLVSRRAAGLGDSIPISIVARRGRAASPAVEAVRSALRAHADA